MNKPTKRQLQLLGFIHDFTQRRGIAPTYREAGEWMGLCCKRIHELIRRLEAEGCITPRFNTSRALTLTPWGLQQLRDAGMNVEVVPVLNGEAIIEARPA